jgi:hypothetical protein
MYAKLNSYKTEVIDWIDSDTLPPHKAGYILPVVVDDIPEYNTETQEIVESTPIVESDRVRKTWQVVDIVVPVPDEIPLWAFRTAIRKAELKESVEALLNALPEPNRTDALEHYEYGNFIVRHHPLIAALAFQLGLTEKQVDDIFIFASKLS